MKKKTKQRNKPRIVRKNRRSSQRRIKGYIKNLPQNFKKSWDFKKTLKQNYSLLGLALDDRGTNSYSKSAKQQRTSALSHVIIDSLPDESQRTKARKVITFDQAEIIKNLIIKYRDNIDKMFLDIKLNKWQWTKGQIRKKIKLFTEMLENHKEEEDV